MAARWHVAGTAVAGRSTPVALVGLRLLVGSFRVTEVCGWPPAGALSGVTLGHIGIAAASAPAASERPGLQVAKPEWPALQAWEVGPSRASHGHGGNGPAWPRARGRAGTSLSWELALAGQARLVGLSESEFPGRPPCQVLRLAWGRPASRSRRQPERQTVTAPDSLSRRQTRVESSNCTRRRPRRATEWQAATRLARPGAARAPP